jgi:hypothetical protein
MKKAADQRPFLLSLIRLICALRQDFKGRQSLAFQHFQERAATGRDVAHLLFDAVLGNGSQGVTTARNAESF